MIGFVGVLLLCAASMVIGRLVLTREEAWRTITVRLPALGVLILATAVLLLFAIIAAVICFVGGSFYGLYLWWFPRMGDLFENSQYLLNAIVSGSWK
jgi:hypothetical protein